MTESPSSATPWGGMRKERPGARNTSMTGMTSVRSAFAIAAMRASGVGRRISRLSDPRSVRHLNSRSAILRSRSLVSDREGLVRVPRQGLRHAADRLQVAQIDGAAIRVAALPVVPGAHQGVLQDRQLVHVVADVVEQALHQARRDAPTAHADGPGDHRLQLVAGQAAESGTGCR